MNGNFWNLVFKSLMRFLKCLPILFTLLNREVLLKDSGSALKCFTIYAWSWWFLITILIITLLNYMKIVIIFSSAIWNWSKYDSCIRIKHLFYMWILKYHYFKTPFQKLPFLLRSSRRIILKAVTDFSETTQIASVIYRRMKRYTTELSWKFMLVSHRVSRWPEPNDKRIEGGMLTLMVWGPIFYHSHV